MAEDKEEVVGKNTKGAIDKLSMDNLDDFFERIILDMKGALDLFKEGEQLFTPEDIDHEVVLFNGEVKIASANAEVNETIDSYYINCPSSGILSLKHRFESIADIPISWQKFTIKVFEVSYPLNGPNSAHVAFRDELKNLEIQSSFDGNGEAEVDVSHLQGKHLEIHINPKENLQNEFKVLYESYGEVLNELVVWLKSQLATQKDEIILYSQQNGFEKFAENVAAEFKGMIDAILGFFSSIASAVTSVLSGEFYGNFKNIDGKELLESLGKNAEKFAYVVSDEIVLFLIYYAVSLYLLTLTPPQRNYFDAFIGTNVAIEIALTFFTGGAMQIVNRSIDFVEVVNTVDLLGA